MEIHIFFHGKTHYVYGHVQVRNLLVITRCFFLLKPWQQGRKTLVILLEACAIVDIYNKVCWLMSVGGCCYQTFHLGDGHGKKNLVILRHRCHWGFLLLFHIATIRVIASQYCQSHIPIICELEYLLYDIYNVYIYIYMYIYNLSITLHTNPRIYYHLVI